MLLKKPFTAFYSQSFNPALSPEAPEGHEEESRDIHQSMTKTHDPSAVSRSKDFFALIVMFVLTKIGHSFPERSGSPGYHNWAQDRLIRR